MHSSTNNGTIAQKIDKRVDIMRPSRSPNHRQTKPIPHLKRLKYVIFPNNIIIQIWDFIMILSIWYCAFFIPFRFGISGGYFTGTRERGEMSFQKKASSIVTRTNDLIHPIFVLLATVYSDWFWIFNTAINTSFTGEKTFA